MNCTDKNAQVFIDTKGSDLLDPVTEKFRGRNEYTESLGSSSASKQEDAISYCVSSTYDAGSGNVLSNLCEELSIVESGSQHPISTPVITD